MNIFFGRSRCLFFFSLALAVLGFRNSARAQATDADRARLLRAQAQIQQVPSQTSSDVVGGYAAPSPNDTDLGEQEILKRVEHYNAFTIETGVPFYYTSNVALVNHGALDDVITAPVIGITYAPRLQKTLYGEFSVRQQFFYYNDFSGFNFASFDATAGLAYYLPQFHNLALRADFDYNRLTGTDNFDDFFSNYSLILTAQVPVRIGRAQQLSFGASANISLYATPSPPQRNDLSAFVGYQVLLTRALALDAAAQLVLRPYDSGGRTDVSEVLSLSANYNVRDWLTLSAISTFVANQSNHGVFDYNVFNIGAALGLTWHF